MRMDLIVVLLLALSSDVNSYVFYLVSETMNWADAQTYCRQHHTDLATFNDQTDIDGLLKSLPSSFRDDMWIGFHWNDEYSPWVWSDGSKSLFRSWQSSQPNNYGGNQYCVHMTTTGYWNDRACPDKLPFICYALSSDVNSYVFYLVSETMNWTDAQTYCRQHHTDLATFNDQTDISELLKSLPSGFRDDMWIGLNRMDEYSPWVWIWSDGSKSLFRSWESSQPNNYDGNQYCVHMTTTGYWNDRACLDKLPFICYEKKIQIVRMEVKSSQNMNDPAVKNMILVKLEQILKEKGLSEDAKLLWMMFSGENVFHKMKEDQKSDVSNAPCKRTMN